MWNAQEEKNKSTSDEKATKAKCVDTLVSMKSLLPFTLWSKQKNRAICAAHTGPR